MITGQAWVETPNASRYLILLCKHFRHKAPTEWTETEARVDFPFGLCRMTADARRLVMDCSSQSEADFLRLQFVLDEHLKRFGRKEGVELSWGTAAP